jgi:hypothetical protein
MFFAEALPAAGLLFLEFVECAALGRTFHKLHPWELPSGSNAQRKMKVAHRNID